MTRSAVTRLPALLLALLASAGWPPLAAQNASAPAAVPAATWQQLEATYQAELKKIHLPLLSGYVADLQYLAAQSRNAETTVAVNEELRRVQAIINAGGVIDLARIAAELNNTAPPGEPAPPAVVPPAGRALITLSPALAARIEPAPAPGDNLESVPVVKIAWNIEALPKGAYELVAQCSVTELDGAASLQITCDHQQLDFPLLNRHLAAGPGDFRLLRLGRLELPLDIKDTPLELMVSPEDARVRIRLRQLFITRASPGNSKIPNPAPSQP